MQQNRFDVGWARLSTDPITPKWFGQLRTFYSECDSRQVDETRRRLGWAPEQCAEPTDAFAACFSDRLKPSMQTVDHAVSTTRAMCSTGGEDYREQILSAVGQWYALILASYDADAIFKSMSTWLHRPIRSSLQDLLAAKDWEFWGYDIERDVRGYVNIYVSGR